MSQIDNPATLGLFGLGQHQASIEGQFGIAHAVWRGPIDTDESDRKFIPLGNAGIVWPLNEKLTLGLALHSKDGLGTRYSMRHLMIPWTKRRVGGDLAVVAPQVNLGYRLTDSLSLGAGVRMEVATAEFSTVLGPFDMDMPRGYTEGAGFQLGLHYQARKDLAFGLAYRSPTWFGDLDAHGAQANFLGFLPVPLGEAIIPDFKLPQRIAAGTAWDVTDDFRLIGEVRWLNYNASTFNSTTLGTDGWIDLRYPLPMGYRDQWAFILGTEYDLTERFTVGAGYHYATAPVDRAHMLPMGSTISQHHITAGCRYDFGDWWLGVSYSLGLPTTLKGSGRSAIPLGFDYGVSEIEQTQHIIAVGVGFSW